MGIGYSAIGFVPPETVIDFSQLYAELKQRFPKWRTVYGAATDTESQAITIYPDETEWGLSVGYQKDQEVRDESPKLAAGIARNDAERDRIAACRIWITIDSDTDYNLDYLTDYIMVMEFLEKNIPDVKYWDNITGEWLPE